MGLHPSGESDLKTEAFLELLGPQAGKPLLGNCAFIGRWQAATKTAHMRRSILSDVSGDKMRPSQGKSMKRAIQHPTDAELRAIESGEEDDLYDCLLIDGFDDPQDPHELTDIRRRIEANPDRWLD